MYVSKINYYNILTLYSLPSTLSGAMLLQKMLLGLREYFCFIHMFRPVKLQLFNPAELDFSANIFKIDQIDVKAYRTKSQCKYHVTSRAEKRLFCFRHRAN